MKLLKVIPIESNEPVQYVCYHPVAEKNLIRGYGESNPSCLAIEYDYESLLADFPENKPLYKDSGLWQMRSDDMEEVLIQQEVSETDDEFIERCKSSNLT